jgi:hypothetical protein
VYTTDSQASRAVYRGRDVPWILILKTFDSVPRIGQRCDASGLRRFERTVRHHATPARDARSNFLANSDGLRRDPELEREAVAVSVDLRALVLAMLRASVGSTEASNGRLARFGVVGPKRARPLQGQGRVPVAKAFVPIEGLRSPSDYSNCAKP